MTKQDIKDEFKQWLVKALLFSSVLKKYFAIFSWLLPLLQSAQWNLDHTVMLKHVYKGKINGLIFSTMSFYGIINMLLIF